MQTFAEVTAAAPAVLIDCASAVIQVGELTPSGESRWARSEAEAGLGLFACLKELSIAPERVEAWIFCTGPGSILGIRTAAMALRTWGVLRTAPIHAYLSLALVAQLPGVHELALGSAATMYFQPGELFIFNTDGALICAPGAAGV